MKTVKRIKRSLEHIQQIANKYKRRSDFAKLDYATYQAAKKRDDYEQIVAHMDPPATKAYSLEEIRSEANKYKKRVEFKKGNCSIYQAALNRDDYDEIVAHMDDSVTEPY